MKTTLILGAALALATAAQATLFHYNYDVTDTLIPDGSTVGYADTHAIGSVAGGGVTDEIVNVNVRLNLTGGYNGDLYGYLLLQNGAGTTSSILLNRIGRTGTDYGSAGSGLANITLSSSGVTDIHTELGSLSGGTYQADGRAVDPNSDFSTATRTAGLNVFNGQLANGTWTLFLADLSGGDQSTLVSWGLDITVVPEPATWALGIFGVLLGGTMVVRRLRRQTA